LKRNARNGSDISYISIYRHLASCTVMAPSGWVKVNDEFWNGYKWSWPVLRCHCSIRHKATE